jgi:hypothetical protein
VPRELSTALMTFRALEIRTGEPFTILGKSNDAGSVRIEDDRTAWRVQQRIVFSYSSPLQVLNCTEQIFISLENLSLNMKGKNNSFPSGYRCHR